MELSRLGKLGVWTWLDALGAPDAVEFARKVEAWGYSVLWLPEAVGRDPFALIGFLGAATSRLVFATGIANLYARDPMTMNALRLTLGDLTGGRFVLGIGVSHSHLVTGVRKHAYGKPVSTMRDYLEAMKGKPYMAPAPPSEPPILLAALRPRMLQLAKELAQGAHPYFVPPEHTTRARKILGPGPWLAPEQMVLRETNPGKARTIARGAMKIYLSLPNYQNNLRWLGYDDHDLKDGGSDRLVDAIVCWGDEQTIASRIKAHLDAGADHVCIQPLRADGKPGPDLDLLAALAPGRM
ncbi:MAG TPA: TIGR03620 family F420-dependent LLM class oxidoreductase [Myxococcota bacterium]|nr:TIGR03620 family F420-dependent LLM class oxidoreductase [Myxococcota bacterium]